MGRIPGSGEGKSHHVERPRKECACGAKKNLTFSQELNVWVCEDCRAGINGI